MLDDMDAARALVAKRAAQITDLQAQIAVLQADQQRAQRRLDAYKYPVLTLANEVTEEIFRQVFPPYPEAPPHTKGKFFLFPVTHVCSQWRKIAVQTRVLWRAIDLPEPTHRGGRSIAAKMTATWLERSGNYPLSIHGVPNALPHLLLTLAPYRPRWEHLSLSVTNVAQFAEVAAGPMPLLRSLTLRFIESSNTAALASIQHSDSPLLRSVSLEPYPGPALILPWSQLTSLTLRRTSPDDALPILRRSARLVHCTLHLVLNPMSNGAWLIRTEDIVLPRLETLVFEATTASVNLGKRVLKILNTPALLSLEVPERFISSASIAPTVVLTEFIVKCGCALQKLKVSGAQYTEQVYRTALPSIDEITAAVSLNISI
ncbi:F-box domain-containing protein [Favolaschia claudopus]|uniref:F-box domain-containing protein n=1 Tax=Favolaschia claudopus TaxID=2862362 RepID=A0AAW0APB0_9AGAR